jgi:hypothetical protein
VLRVDLAAAAESGIAPEHLVGDDYEPCRRWVDGLLAGDDPPSALLVPSAALPGTENLVLFGVRQELDWQLTPRRRRDLPCAVVAMRGCAASTLPAAVHHIGAGAPHPALVAWRRGETYRFAQPRAA